MNIIDGAYSLVLMSPQKLICVRDPYGFHPLCYGRRPDGMYIIASESCAIKAVGAEVIRDVERANAVFSKNGIVSRREHCKKKTKAVLFEYIYFARPDSVIDGVSVHSRDSARARCLPEPIPRRPTSLSRA
jgi:amidophosphoribosyltransferase